MLQALSPDLPFPRVSCRKPLPMTAPDIPPETPAAPLASRSDCPVARALEMVGDRWSLLIVRDMLLFRKSTFSEFLDSAEGIASNVLTERLKALEVAGLIEKRQNPTHRRRFTYHLTRAGRALEPVLRGLMRWGLRDMPGAAFPRSEPRPFLLPGEPRED